MTGVRQMSRQYSKGTESGPMQLQVSFPNMCTMQDPQIIDQGQSYGSSYRHNLIRDTQHRFMPEKLCTTNLKLFLDIVTKAVDEVKAVAIVHLDFVKAFDKVSKQRLPKETRSKRSR